jgi:hypothetical protein
MQLDGYLPGARQLWNSIYRTECVILLQSREARQRYSTGFFRGTNCSFVCIERCLPFYFNRIITTYLKMRGMPCIWNILELVCTLSENIEFICTSFISWYKSEPYTVIVPYPSLYMNQEPEQLYFGQWWSWGI